MSPAILHITGASLDPNVVFASLQIKPYALYTAGQTIPGRASYAIFRQFPVELLLLAGSLGISIEISCYAVEDAHART